MPTLSSADTARRRAAVVRFLVSTLTSAGTDEGGLAPLLLDDGGRASDALSDYLYSTCGEPALVLQRFDQTPTLSDFRKLCLEANAPAVFPFDASEPLAALCSTWVSDGKPFWPELLRRFPAATRVVATDCAQGFARQHLSLSDYAALYESSAECSLYLKDVHLFAASQEAPVRAPVLFEDWFGEGYDGGLGGAPDLRFLYLGRAGTGTPTHVDVGETYSWSWSLAGAKLWRMWTASASRLLLDRWGGPPPRWPHEASRALYPQAAAAPCLEFISRPGEVVFVPSGVWHNVLNLEDAVSVSCNWVNAHNVHHVCQAALKEASGAEAERLAGLLLFIARRRLAEHGRDHTLTLCRIQACLTALPQPATWKGGDAGWQEWLAALA